MFKNNSKKEDNLTRVKFCCVFKVDNEEIMRYGK